MKKLLYLICLLPLIAGAQIKAPTQTDLTNIRGLVTAQRRHVDSLELDPASIYNNATFKAFNDARIIQLAAQYNYKPLAGKTVAVLGDSFVQQGLVQGYITQITGATLSYTDGVGGSCIAGVTASGGQSSTAEGDGTTRTSITDDSRLNPWINSGADYLVFWGELNDTYYQTSLGTVNSTDDSFGGRLNKMLNAYEAKNATTPTRLIAFTGTVRAGSNKAGTPYTDANLDALQGVYINLEIAIFQKHHIPLNVPYFDLGVNLHNYQPYTTTDPVHLNSDAGKLLLGTYVANRVMYGANYFSSTTASVNSLTPLAGTPFDVNALIATNPANPSFPGSNAFDGDINTFYASNESPSNAAVGIDFGSNEAVYLVQLYPRNTNSTVENRMVGAIIQGSTDGTNYTNLVTIPQTTPDQYNSFSVSGNYRYIRIYRNDGQNLDVAEMRVFGNAAPAAPTNSTVSSQYVSWSYLVGSTTYSPYTLTAGTNIYAWNNGASGSLKFVSGDCSFDLPSQAGHSIIVGLSDINVNNTGANQDADYNTVKYGVYLSGSYFRVFEKGNNMLQVAVSGNHAISVKVESGAVNYYLDGVKQYTSTQTLAYPLIPVATMATDDQSNPATVANATITGTVTTN